MLVMLWVNKGKVSDAGHRFFRHAFNTFLLQSSRLLLLTSLLFRSFLTSFSPLVPSPTTPQSNITMANTTTDTLKQSTTGFEALASLAHPMQTAVVAALILVICAYLPKLRYRAQLAKLPVFSEATSGKDFFSAAKEWYDEGYAKVSHASALVEDRSDISSSKTRPTVLSLRTVRSTRVSTIKIRAHC